MKKESHACSKKRILTCSGGCGLGQLANRAALELACEKFGELFCLSAIAAGIDEFVQSAKDVDDMVIIDGCDTACGRKILEKADINVKNHIIVSQLEIDEKDSLLFKPDDLATIKHHAKLALRHPIKFTFSSPKPLSPGDRAKSKLLGGKCC